MARSPLSLHICVSYSAGIALPSLSFTTPRRVRDEPEQARPYAAPRSSTPGAIPISISGARAMCSPSPVEHRAAPSQKPIRIELVEAGEALALRVPDRSEPATVAPSSLDERIASALADAASPLPFGELRSKCRVRATTLYERLAALTATGRIVKAGDGGYRLVGA